MSNKPRQSARTRRALAWRLLTTMTLLATLLGGALTGAPTALAADCQVTTTADSGAGSLRAALANTDGFSNCTTITFAVSLNGGTINLATDLPTITTSRTITGPGAASLTINGAGSFTQFIINAPDNTDSQIAISGLTLTNAGSAGAINNVIGNVTLTDSVLKNNGSGVVGGINSRGTLTVRGSTFTGNDGSLATGIYNNNGTLVVENSTFFNNTSTASAAGAIYTLQGTTTITGSTFTNNTAGDSGALNQNDGTLTVTGSTFTNNTIGLSGSVGAIYVSEVATTITGSSFTGNFGNVAGGIAASGGTLTVTDSTFDANRSSTAGALTIQDNNIATVQRNTFSNNTGGPAGTIITSTGAALTLTNSTLVGNSGQVVGGIYVNSAGNTTIINTTIANNTGQNPTGGILANATTTLTNTILSNNSPNNVFSGGAFVSGGGNVSSDSNADFSNATDKQALNVGLDPAGLQDNGGPTKTIGLLQSSPALGFGVASACTDPAPGRVNGVDQRGVTRPQGVGCDSGAFEVLLHPVPALTALSPAMAVTGSPDTVVTVDGTGFVQGVSTVTLGGSPLETLYVSATRLRAIIPAAQLATASSRPLVVGNAAPGGGTSGALTFSVVPPAAPIFTVTVSQQGNGTVSPLGAATFPGGTVGSFAATAAAGQVFLGWTLDGQYVGYANPLTLTVTRDQTLVATFAARPTFGDIPAGDADYNAVTTLAALGIINPTGVNGTGQFQPDDAVNRAQVAAFVARTFGWNREFHRNSFPDKCDAQGNCIDDELWNNVAALADYGVVGGYTDPATCASVGTSAPCYLPRDNVNRLQVVSIVARAFTKTDGRATGFWDRLPQAPGQYTNVADSGTQRSDLATYRQNAGPIPGQADDGTFPDPTGPASRRFIIEVLWQAYSSVYSGDNVP